MVGYRCSTAPSILFTNNSTISTGNGTIEWIQVTDSTVPKSSITSYYPYPTATVRVRSTSALLDNALNDWGGLYVGDPYCINTEYEWTTDGTATRFVVYRGNYNTNYMVLPEATLAERLKKVIAERCAPNFIRNRKALDLAPDIREIRARQTLRRVIGDEKFQNFIKKGFISVRAKSGKSYQIFPGHGLTNVYFCGKMVEKLCVVMIGDFPATDSLIMRYLLILNNEDQFRSLANVSGPTSIPFRALPKEPDKRTLSEIFAAFKGQKRAAA